jgi:hypothetical protein
MLGNDLKAEDVLMLAELGYNYANGVLYDPTGNPIAQSMKEPVVGKPVVGKPVVGEPIEDEPPEESKGATSPTVPEAVKSAASALGNATKPPKIDNSENDDDEEEKKYNTYANLFYGSPIKGFTTYPGGSFSYDFALTKAENAALYCKSLNVSEAEKEKIFEIIMAGEK